MQEEVVLSGGRETVEAARGAEQVTRSKKKKSESMPTLVSSHEASCDIAAVLISRYHHHLASANIMFLCVNKPIKGVGGKVQKATPLIKYLADLQDCEMATHKHVWHGDLNRDEVDFIVTISLDAWNQADNRKRAAMVDHLLCRMTGQENEETGEMKWKTRDPDVQEFAECAERHGSWNNALEELRDCLTHEVLADSIRGTLADRFTEKNSSENWDPETAPDSEEPEFVSYD